MPASIKSTAVIVWMALLLSPVVRADYTRNGDDWNYFEQYVHSASKPENAVDRPSTRQLGTFWKTKMAKDYDVTKALGDGKCGVAFYFPEMPRRIGMVPDEANKAQLTEEPADWNRDKGSIEIPVYRRPLAVSGVCKDFEPPEGINDYPRSYLDRPDLVRADRVVFHNLHSDASRDAYATISFRGKDTELGDCWENKFPEDYDVDIQFAVPEKNITLDAWKNGNDRSDESLEPEIKLWLEDYIKHRNGCLPNPRVYGIGDRVWTDYTDVDKFWGFKPDSLDWADALYEHRRCAAQLEADAKTCLPPYSSH